MRGVAPVASATILREQKSSHCADGTVILALSGRPSGLATEFLQLTALAFQNEQLQRTAEGGGLVTAHKYQWRALEDAIFREKTRGKTKRSKNDPAQRKP